MEVTHFELEDGGGVRDSLSLNTRQPKDMVTIFSELRSGAHGPAKVFFFFLMTVCNWKIKNFPPRISYW